MPIAHFVYRGLRQAFSAGVISMLPMLAAMAAEPDARKPEPSKPAWNVNQPPGTTRTVNLDTRTGTWMSVDISPDGQTLLFDLLGDLYLLPMSGGEARPLTHSIAWEQQARFSPDGRKVVIDSAHGGTGRQMYLIDLESVLAG